MENFMHDLTEAEKKLGLCQTDFESFYRAAMFCEGTRLYTLALMRMGNPTIECVKVHTIATNLINKFNKNYC